VPLLRQGVAELGLALPESAEAELAAYLELLVKWNRVYNLTAVREQAKLISHHLLDSLAVIPQLPAGRLIDVGSGAGLPGIPIALACRNRSVTLLDSSHKKGAFLKQAIAELRLTNANVVIDRVEAYRPIERFDVVITRAFSDLADFANLAGHLCKPQGVLVAMKGVHPHEEIAQIPESWAIERVIPLRVPQLDAARHLVLLRARTAQETN
jgi:16S rRNA (guanine527-N7)-methyltransferase